MKSNYKLRTWGEHVVHTNCFLFLIWHSEQFMHTTCSELVIFMYWTGKSMNNLLSYCGLLDVRINASDKDIPVNTVNIQIWILNCLHCCDTNRTFIRNLLFDIDFSLLSIQLLGIHRCPTQLQTLLLVRKRLKQITDINLEIPQRIAYCLIINIKLLAADRQTRTCFVQGRKDYCANRI